MDLRNWETYIDSGAALIGASVYARDAVLTHPNTGTVVASTVTDSNGVWAFTGLTNTPKDIEVVWGNTSQYHKWYKGMTRHDVATIFFSEAPVLPAGSIPTAALAANAVTQVGSATGVTSSPTTTSNSYVDLPDMSVTLTTTGGDLLAFFTGTFLDSAVANVALAFSLDGSAEVGGAAFTEQTATYYVPVSQFWRFVAPSAASHTIKMRWNTTVGTLTNLGVQRVLIVMEIKR